MDCIELSHIRAYGYTGFLPEEQILGQWFSVDLKIWLDLAPAGQCDDLSQTLDYRAAIERTQTLIQTEKFLLVERLADAIAQAILNLDKATQVNVRLHKVAAPIANFSGTITIDITRQAQ